MEVMAPEIAARLESDTRFDFKRRGKYLQQGICPQCTKKELFIAIDKPWMLKCNRSNNCNYEENTREIYPDLFNNYAERFPPTEENPKATADAYMSQNRQFPLHRIGSWYSQETYRLPRTNRHLPTVRFYIDAKNTRYWERLIGQAKSDGQRINFGGPRKVLSENHADYADYNNTLVKGEWWTPPDQKIQKGDSVYLVEGIFHAIALTLKGYKAAATLMAGNFPALSIKKHLKKDIQWILALDDDPAGRKSMASHARKLDALGETALAALTDSEKDWDDLYRADMLSERFMADALYRGRLFRSKTIQEKAYHFHRHTKLRYSILDHASRLYSIRIAENLESALACLAEDTNYQPKENESILDTTEGRRIFNSNCKTEAISNCLPQFLYCQVDKFSSEIAYAFNIKFPNGNPEMQIAFSGSAIESAPSFNKALLNQAAGATFDGGAAELKLIRDRWFKDGVKHVQTVPFIGYDKVTQTYAFQSFAYHQGKQLKLNAHGYFDAGKHRIKTSFKGFHIHKADSFDPSWLPNYAKVFSDNGMIALAFFVGSLFAEQIRARHKAFPFLEMTGDHGAGKTTQIEFLWKLIGRDDYEGFDPSKATFAARARAFMQGSNMPVVLIESDRIDDKAKKGTFDFEELKTAYNGRAIRSLGAFNRGVDIEEPPFRGSIVIAQNAEVEGSPALMSRIVHLHYSTAHFTQETKALATDIERAQTEKMAGLLPECLQREEEILKVFNEKFVAIEQIYHDSGEIRDQRIIKTHAMLAAMVHSLQLVFPNLTDKATQRLQNYLLSRAKTRQARMSADHPLVQSFWEAYELLNIQPGKEMGLDIDRVTLNHAADDYTVAINLKHFNQVCAQSRVELIPSDQLKKLLPNSKRYKYQSKKSVKSKILGKAVWCWVFEIPRPEARA